MLGNHFLGLYEKALPADIGWKEKLTLVRELGFDYLEISIDESDEKLARCSMPAAEREEILRLIGETGIPIRSLCLSGHRRFPFGSADPAVRARAKQLMRDAVLLATSLGIRVIQLAGYDVYYEPSDRRSEAAFLEGMKEAAGLAEQHQIMLGVETMDTGFLNSISKYYALKAHIPSPWFRVYPDIGNLSAWENDVEEELHIGIHEIVAIHLKETLQVTDGNGGQFRDVPFGSGCVHFADCFRHLEKIGYRGPYLVEMWNRGPAWKEEIRAAKGYLENCFAEALKG